MSLIVAAVGVLMLIVSGAILVHPGKLKAWLAVYLSREWIGAASLIRVIVGLLFIAAAPDTRAAGFIVGVGIVLIVAGLTIPLIGAFRVINLGDWWLQRPDGVLRAWAVVAATLGAAILWTAL